MHFTNMRIAPLSGISTTDHPDVKNSDSISFVNSTLNQKRTLMQRKILIILLVIFTGSLSVFSQKITGKVTSPDEPQGIPGVNVLIRGTHTGTVTDLDGYYSLDVPNDTCTLVFSYVGYNTEETGINGKTTINMMLIPNLEKIDEVVVTALGIKRDEKALGYSVQKVGGDEIAKVKELDVVNALSGKVSGVNIIQADGSLGGGGSRIVIRGESSLAGNNDPLFIINGIPGSANDIAADDVESISVLKGPAAAALYGSKAGAGVVIITSKSGKNKEGLLFEFNSNMTFQSPLVLPEYQNKFGQGESGDYSYYDGNGNGTYDDTYYNWGPAFDGNLRSQFTGNKPWVAYEDNVKDFYQTGHIYVNNISLSSSGEKGNYRFSYSNTDQKGILPNTGQNSNHFDLNSTFKLLKNLSLNADINYIRTRCDNNKGVDVRFIPRSIDIAALKDYWIPGMEGLQQMNYRRSANNPYFELFENISSYNDNKLILNINLNYEISEHFNLIARYGTNYTNNEYYARDALSTYMRGVPLDAKGFYRNGQANSWDRTAEFLFSYNNNFFNTITTKLSFGGTHYHQEYAKIQGEIFDFIFSGLYNLNNREEPISIDNYLSALERNSLYGFLNFDYKGKVFLDITGRNDWSSTLSPENNSFFYPSATMSALIDEIIELPHQISFWKIRGSWAQVGKDIPSPYFITEDKYYWSTNSITGSTYPSASDIKTDPNIKPEITTGLEFGTDIRFFNNRLGVDFTYYYSATENQILKTAVSNSTNYNYFMMNAGKISSKGIELTINATPIKTGDLTWDIQLNWSRDRTFVDELIDSLPSISKTQSVNSFLSIEDRVGQRRGTFYGKSYERAPNGERLYSLSGDTRLTEETQLGNYNPDWMASINNAFEYKKISLSFLLDLRYGGMIYNEIERRLNIYGLSKATLLNDRVGIVPDGMVEENGTYREITLADLEKFGKSGGQTGQEYWANQMEETCPENELIDDTYLKLRELRLAYTIPEKYLQKTFIKSVTVALVGRNLAVWSKVKHIDPETFGYSSEASDFGWSSKIPGFANSSFPSVRSYGFTLSCKF
jgi:TonB-linked SusC/RagA family outer membrane protein